MYTYNLNRPLFSFGLGIWIVEIITPEPRTFIVHESRLYKVYELIRQYNPSSYRIYKARATIGKPRTYYVPAIGRIYFPIEVRSFKSAETRRHFVIFEISRTCTVHTTRTYKAMEYDRTFRVQAARDYNL